MADISKITIPNGTSYDLKDATARTQVAQKLPLAGGTLTGRLITAKTINQIITGTGTAAKDAGSGTNRYQPAKWTFDTGLTATDGEIITIKVPVAGHSYGVYVSIDNGSRYYPVVTNGTARVTTHYPVNTYLMLAFETAGSAASIYPVAGGTATGTVTGGAWRVLNYYDSNSNTVPAAQCETAAATAAKVGTCTNFSLLAKSYVYVNMRYANTAQSAITMNINSTGAKPIYINGAASSASNYTLPAGSYLAYYNGTNYYFRTDGNLLPAVSVGSASGWSTGTLPTLGTAITADDITAWTTNTPTAVTKKTVVTAATFNTVVTGVTKKTVVTSASGGTASYANGVLTISDASFGTGDSVAVTTGASGSATTGDSVTVTAGKAASLTYTERSIPNVTGVGTLPALTVTSTSVAKPTGA